MVFPTIWASCKPRSDVIEETLQDAELALSLPAIVWGTAKPPYNDPKTFFETTHVTDFLKISVSDVIDRLSGKGKTEPFTVLDVGFGGGKTHTLASLFYAAKFGAPQLTDKKAPNDTIIVALSGEEYGSDGLSRKGTKGIKTMWGDFFHQLNKYNDYKELDSFTQFPATNKILEAMGEKPVLILIDEIPTYLNAISVNSSSALDAATHFIQRLISAVAGKSNAYLLMTIAEDAYKHEALEIKASITESIEEALKNIGAIAQRQEVVRRPLEEADVVGVLKKRLFEKIPDDVAKKTADAYFDLYKGLGVPDKYKKASYRDQIESNYPFHPELMRVFYERLAVVPGFNRTRGALRLLSKVIVKIWKEKENDALLIHPFHIDLVVEGIANELSTKLSHLKKYHNAIEADIGNSMGTASAQQLDKISESHWKAPLTRRVCNTIYLYSLHPGIENQRGSHVNDLPTLLVTPANKDHFFAVRDTVLESLDEHLSFVDRIGERYVFTQTAGLTAMIRNHAREIPANQTLATIRQTAESLYAGEPEWMYISKMFVNSISDFDDDTNINVGILNPIQYTITSGQKLDQNIKNFLDYKDDQAQRARVNKNSSFLIVADTNRKVPLLNIAAKLTASKEIELDPRKFNIDEDRKSELSKQRAEYEKRLFDEIRSTFTNLLYIEKTGVEVKQFNPSGYGSAKKGKEVIAKVLETMNKILTQAFDPDYLKLQNVWPKNETRANAVELYHEFHKRPGLEVPTKKDYFDETIRRGIIQKYWILKNDNKIITPEVADARTSILISENSELILYDEAERQGLLAPKEEAGKLGKPIEPPAPPSETETFDFPNELLTIAADSIPKKMKPEGFTKVNFLQISTKDNPTHILNANFLLTSLSSEKDCKAMIQAHLQRYANPEYDVSIKVVGDDLVDDIGKKCIELSRKFAGTNSATVTVTLEWSQGISPEKTVKLIKDHFGKDKLVGDVKVGVSR